MFAFPGLVLAIVIAGLLGASRTNAMIAIGLVYAPAFARVIRGSVLSIMSEPYVEAGRVVGATNGRLVHQYVLPNIVAPLIVMISVYLSSAILAEAALELPRARHAAAGAGLGRDAEPGAHLHGDIAVDGHFSWAGHHDRRHGVQLPGGWPAGHS